MRSIRINHPGDGEWIMERCEGVFHPMLDHSIAVCRDEELLGGFVASAYMGNSITIHVAGANPRWATRDVMWMIFHYIFHQLKCHKAFATVASDNHHALELDLRAGWQLETVIRDVFAPGRHLVLLSMTAATCPWLKVIPKQYYDRSRRVGPEVNGREV